jgi:hypothetical protein
MDQPESATVKINTVLSIEDNERFDRACALTDRSKVAQLRVLVREFNASVLDTSSEAAA